MKIIAKGIKPIFLGLALFAFGSSSLVLAASHAEESEAALFQLGEKTYQESDLPQLLQQALYDARLEHYKAQQAIIDEALVVMEIEKRAKENDKDSEAMAAELFKAEAPTEDEVKAFYEDNKERINQPLEKVKAPIMQMLLQQAQAMKQQAFLTELKEKRAFKLGLVKPVAPMAEIVTAGFPEKGGKDAKAVLIEFADYQCPHCKRAGDVLKQVAEQFKDDLKIVFMDFPINRSGISRKIAEGAACAGKQDKYWEYHDLAFSDQRALKKDSAPGFAETLGLDADAFAKCLASDYPAEQVAKGEKQGKELGVNSTPTLFLNGRRLHLHDLEKELPEAIKQAIAKATK